MKSTGQFIEASKDKKVQFIQDGLQFITKQLRDQGQSFILLRHNMEILNRWLTVYPTFIECGYADVPDRKTLLKAVVAYNNKLDGFTSLVVAMEEKMNDLFAALGKLESWKKEGR